VSTENPIKQFRSAENLTMQELADLSGVSKSAVLRAEQGVFNDIPPALVDFISSRGYDILAYAAGYRRFIVDQRKRSYGTLITELPPYTIFKEALTNPRIFTQYLAAFVPGDSPLADNLLLANYRSSEYRSLSHPFVQWRLSSGISAQIQIAKSFCIHPAHLSSYELRANTSHTPPQIMTALREAGYSDELLSQLDRRYLEYRQHLIQVAIKPSQPSVPITEGAA
jgi:transcriptional regulator with XRE-family HTH domain